MTTFNNMISNLKKFGIAALVVVTLANCSDEKELVTPTVSASQNTAVSSTTVENAEVPNFTISGIHTEVVSSVDCATCTFVVAAGTTVVDGNELDIEPGAVVCLQTGVQYPSMEFVNLIGEESNPITIGYCKN